MWFNTETPNTAPMTKLMECFAMITQIIYKVIFIILSGEK